MPDQTSSWWLVTSEVGESFVMPQFAVLADSAEDAIERVTVTWVRELNALLPADRQLTVGTAERIGSTP